MSSITAPIVGIDPITPRSRLITIDVHNQTLDFRPGQAIMLGSISVEERRPYSIACSPERAGETGCLELLISVEDDGSLGPHLIDAHVGSVVKIEGPRGTFVLPLSPSEQYLLFVAGGTGIAPLRSMIDHTVRTRSISARIALLYSARRGDEFAFIDELRRHARAGSIELHETVTRDVTWEGPRGRIGRGHFDAVLHDPASTLCFVCGPPRLVTESVAMLTALGVPWESIRTEQWAS